VRFPPANMQLRRAQLVLMLAILIPTIAMTSIGILLLILRPSTTSVISGVLVLAFCTSTITGLILVSVFVGRGASLVRVQNDFVSSVSHELRTPITSIRLFIESLRDGRLEETDRVQVLTLLGRETERLELLVGRVLELSRLNSNYVYARDRIFVADLFEDAVAAFDAITLTNPTKVIITLEPGLSVVGDRPTLVRALVNLMTNAWRYTSADKRIALDGRTSGRWIDLSVRDNGKGIARDEKKSIFEQFSRGRAAHETGVQGIGLGLSFVQAIVRGHRGRIAIESEPGRSELTIRLRRRRRPRTVITPSLAEQAAS
jgi:two-component system phosphate regulon sensor histidine kinase PhoR